MKSQKVHQPYCFAGQPAARDGYFEDDLLPCICATQDLLFALQNAQTAAIPIYETRDQIKCA
jgi:hypothetical protein